MKAQNMAIQPIILYPDPVLLKPTRPVESIDDEVRALVQDMVETMYAAPGVGLAANQIGVARRVCVIDLSAGKDPQALRALINPVIRHTEGQQVGEMEIPHHREMAF